MISSELRRIKEYIHVYCKCRTCGQEKWIYWDNLRKGKTQGCQSCSQIKSPHQEILGRRYDAIMARCNNPKSKAYRRYGGRGIQCRFKTRNDFVQWVVLNLPYHNYKGIEIDRTDNNGHYEPGNLRLATRQQQTHNTSVNAWIAFQGERIRLVDFKSPYTRSWTRRLAVDKGMTGEQIIEMAKTAVQRHAKHNQKIAARLVALGYTI